MLQHIQILDLVIVEKLELDLSGGMTVLTGETGAGKSILIDALGLALGDKADKSMIRPGSDKAEVTILVDLEELPQARRWLEEHELASDSECILRRILVRQGRSRAFINGRPVPRQLLSEFGEQLVEIHGQHEHQRLLRPSMQRRLLDIWAGHTRLLSQVRRHHSLWLHKQKQLDEWVRQAADRDNRMDYLRFQIEELRRSQLTAEQLHELEQEQKRLAHAGELSLELDRLLDSLYRSEEAVQSRLARAALETGRLAEELAEELGSAAELLENARIEVEEASALLQDFASRVEHNPERLREVEESLGEIHDLARKHRVDPRQLPELLEELEQELGKLEHAEGSLERLQQETAAARNDYLQAAEELSHRRNKAAARLAKLLTASMQELAMKGGRFSIEVTTQPEEKASASGLDDVVFQVSTNPGQPLAPLAKVASGGELSRLSLAIQVATSNLGTVPTLIFDEVDVGIGGAVAVTVGHLLRQLGDSRQILCVTHLPQVAAQAHHHLLVSKQRRRRTTTTEIRSLDKEERIREIARMVGGSRITQQTLAHAEELVCTDG